MLHNGCGGRRNQPTLTREKLLFPAWPVTIAPKGETAMIHPDDLHEDQHEYYRFTGRQRFDRAIHTLEGLVRGIGADGKVNDRELAEVTRWIGEHREFSARHPFNEVIPLLNAAILDGVFDEEERYDVLWLCERIATGSEYYDEATSDMQRLQGFLAGITSDRKIEPHELRNLQDWIDQHAHLKACWPYDEIESLLLEVMRDGEFDEREHDSLMAFFAEFHARPGHMSVASDRPANVLGICAVCPEVVFPQKVFCFTGSSKRASRREFWAIIEERGGEVSKNVVQKLNYLIIGADGNPCWAYSCYGRKVEQAVSLRRQGIPLVIVHENDFWDAVGDV
jgi:hypothetical protein